MDLIERGRSLSEMGRTLRWSDLSAILIHLPPDSHMRKVVSRLGPESGEIQQQEKVTTRADRDIAAREAAARIRAELGI